MQQQTTAIKRAREPSISSDQEDRARTPVDVCLPDSDDNRNDDAGEFWEENNDSQIPDADIIPDLPPSDQATYIQPLKESPLEDGDTWYLVANSWYRRWQQHCTRMASQSQTTRDMGLRSPPGQINNTSLMKDNTLKPNLMPDTDFQLVPEKAWKALVQWYGLTGDEFPRNVITEGVSVQESMVEIYPPQFRIYVISATQLSTTATSSPPSTITLSRKAQVADLISCVENTLDFTPQTEFRILRLEDQPSTTSESAQLAPASLPAWSVVDTSDQSKTISEVYLSEGAIISLVADVKDPISGQYASEDAGGVSIERPWSSSTSNGFGFGLWSGKENKASDKPKGVCGLNNLGNTCFMNSALQCLSNTELLTNWFLAGHYKHDLNPDNPLGMKGEVAEAYGNLIERLWSGTTSSLAPREFKLTIGRFNASFTGYQQHDSQELLAFLLDGLHEDLNRIIKKPYIELPDFDNMPDDEIASKSWAYHKARNDSVIVDLFQGQFKSRLICHECGKVSVTFDPFMYLSLPLPIQKKIKIQVSFVPYDPSRRPVRLHLSLKKDAGIQHLKAQVAEQMNLETPNTLLVTEVFSSKIYKIFTNYEPAGSIQANDTIVVYELPGEVPIVGKRRKTITIDADGNRTEEDMSISQDELIVVPVYCAVSEDKDSENSLYRASVSQFGGPIILAMKKKDATSIENVYREVVQQVERYAVMKLFEERKDVDMKDATTPNSSDKMDISDEDTAQTAPKEPIEVAEEEPVQIQQRPIHTAAAVTAAGGRQLEPMRKLFSMQVFSETRSYGRGHTDLFSTGMHGWDNASLTDLFERAEKEQAQREKFYAPKPTTETSDVDQMNIVGEAPAMESETSQQGSTIADIDDDDEIVEDASSTLPPAPSSMIAGLPRIATPPAPSLLTVPSRPPSSIVIRQGEGIVLQWRKQMAQQVFGSASTSSSSSYKRIGESDAGVCADAWDDMDETQYADEDSGDSKQRGSQKNVTLGDCLDEFTREEELGEDDLWYCPRCKQHQRATKKFDLWRMPEILVVHLKRFSHTRTWRDKIDALIDFPLNGLDLTERVLSVSDDADLPEDQRPIYDLFAVDNHYGGMGGGHYTAYGQNYINGDWYNFDDSHVSKVNAEDVKTPAAYLLFYKRRRSQPLELAESVPKYQPETKHLQEIVPSYTPPPLDQPRPVSAVPRHIINHSVSSVSESSASESSSDDDTNSRMGTPTHSTSDEGSEDKIMMGVGGIGIAIKNGTDLAATPDAQEFEAADSDNSSVVAMNTVAKDDLQSPQTSGMDIEASHENDEQL
ncbi:hypothetical protein K450DRAFT_225674 [Umbelopsis ramanniana AG]|uniref:ubiquitinyl hydrolase 1 n=1 Tax=Umbelopsis ramanniana AG TaxID=1314678 RepID=A0AAD5EH67_UMBRA|nr:uncharacterized protein K450DRAFT_225674 [Umbelopsis ramanniana AG]KAI8582965.1 hypothetical protein K450DRAFT_225674 [Umbelopsis ramanniana AG]